MAKDQYSIMRAARNAPAGHRRFLLRDGLGRQVFGARAKNRLEARCRRHKWSYVVITHAAKFPTTRRFSPHFTQAEFACKDPRRTRVPRRLYGNARRLAIALELVRALSGNMPISLNSVYRTPEWNAHVGGARFSKHMAAMAADLNVTSQTRRRFLIAAKKVDMIKGIGIYPWGGLHLDVRHGVRTFWNSWGR